jgi:hypothetical protein
MMKQQGSEVWRACKQGQTSAQLPHTDSNDYKRTTHKLCDGQGVQAFNSAHLESIHTQIGGGSQVEVGLHVCYSETRDAGVTAIPHHQTQTVHSPRSSAFGGENRRKARANENTLTVWHWNSTSAAKTAAKRDM